MAPHPPYANVFLYLPRTPFLRMKDGARLSVFHSKYWGVGVDQDESKWVGAHSQIMDSGDSEVVRGCFALDLDDDTLAPSKIWIRKDYLRIYDFCERRCEFIRDNLHRAPSVVVTGQPGLGKSYWILYAVRRRLGEAKPFLWHFSKQWYLFVEDGVFQVPPGCLDPTLFTPFIWAFFDADHSSSGVPSDLIVGLSKVFTIFATSPRKPRWHPLTKTTHLVTLIMNPWTWEEVSKAAEIHEFTVDQLTLAREIFLEYGPIPRVCINFVKDPPALHDHRVKIAREISNLTMDSLFSVVQKGEILDMDLSHSIILLKREDVDNLHGFTIEPVSHFVKQLLKRKLMEVEQKEWLLSDLLRTRVKNRRILASLIFESLAQLQFQQEVSLNLVPMAKVPAPPRGNTEWESQPRSSSPTPQNLVDSAGQGSSSVSVDPVNTPFPIRFKPTDTVEYDESKLCGIRADVFYVPTSSNQEAFNSFILVDQVLYIFQFSIAASQEINEGGVMKFFSQPMLKERLQGAEWRFVLVVPPRSTIVFSESNVAMLKGFGDRARLFIGEIDLFK